MVSFFGPLHEDSVRRTRGGKIAPRMDPQAHIVVDDQPFINRTRRERLPIPKNLTIPETSAALEDTFVGKLRQITGIEIAHTGDG